MKLRGFWVLTLLFSAFACSHATGGNRRDLSWMKGATVTVMRLTGDAAKIGVPSLGSFHGTDVVEQHVLDDQSRDAIASFLLRVAAQEDQERFEAQLEGKVTAGVWGCISESRGLRFEFDGFTYDFFVECGLWIQPADKELRGTAGREGTVIAFSREDQARWSAIFERHFTRGP